MIQWLSLFVTLWYFTTQSSGIIHYTRTLQVPLKNLHARRVVFFCDKFRASECRAELARHRSSVLGTLPSLAREVKCCSTLLRWNTSYSSVSEQRLSVRRTGAWSACRARLTSTFTKWILRILTMKFTLTKSKLAMMKKQLLKPNKCSMATSIQCMSI